jgi:dTDP-4-dehydrorhamnose reductase
MGKTALIAGGSGLVGRELLTCLLSGNEYDRVIAITRSSLNITHPKFDERIIDFETLVDEVGFPSVDDVFCCLGTTIKKAKTQEAMKRVDVDYPIALAKLAKKLGAKQYLVISSLGANPNSSIFYSKMKGMLEEGLKQIGFPALLIFRPSLLLGERKEFRLGEWGASILMPVLSLLMIGPLAKYRGIQAKTVANGMYKAAQLKKLGVHVFLSDEIQNLGGNKKVG